MFQLRYGKRGVAVVPAQVREVYLRSGLCRLMISRSFRILAILTLYSARPRIMSACCALSFESSTLIEAISLRTLPPVDV